ncbi:beta-galactosidase [Blastomyces dermatitidis ATCC 18188]|uniref:Beta-galactosidase n=1 Tax=Ajellomyces dermatitidis (strain ATCC 18188 / CBS 674.68) TaxID=653446 RepID=F2T9U0_AJEDA|nr:beta-galactosidase [Blastomyces dermatitidis ATCC 18188]
MRFLSACAIACLALQSAAVVVVDRKLGGFTVIEHPDPAKRDLLQDIVKWDNESLFINGERIMIFSAEFHPFRYSFMGLIIRCGLPVPSLWLDIFQKIKALGFNCVSFYTNWALTEGKPGEYTAEGIFAWEPFFEAATEAGIYLLARPGPCINAEVSGGGFPGWLQRVRGQFRTSDKDYLAATDNYIAHIASPVAKAQITNGGPVILYQPENEHTLSLRIHDFPDGDYMQYVIDQARKAGIVVPMISNDAWAAGNNAPGTGKGEVDIYGHDKYPPIPTSSLLDFCPPIGGSSTSSKVPSHLTPLSSFGNVFLNLYMGHPGGYTSYDYGAPISEDRNITREKYGELKLIGNFMKASPSFMNAVPGHWSISKFTTTPTLTVTSLIGRLSDSSFFVLRHSEYSSKASTNYKLKLPTSVGRLIMPQLNGTLTLNGRDSKIHVTDYDVAGTKYFLFDCRDIHMEEVWGPQGLLVEGPSHDMTIKKVDDYVVLNWETMRERRIVDIGDLSVFILDLESLELRRASPLRRKAVLGLGIQHGSMGVTLDPGRARAILGASSTNIYSFPKLKAGEKYVFTMLVDNMSLGQDYVIGADSTKNPRGIQHYKLFGRLQSRVTWKLAGNLGGEDYQDRFRGPLNEGGLYIERQGWHQPNPPHPVLEVCKPHYRRRCGWVRE